MRTLCFISSETVPTTPRAPLSMGTFYRGEIVRVCTRYTYAVRSLTRATSVRLVRVAVDRNGENVEFDRVDAVLNKNRRKRKRGRFWIFFNLIK